MTWRATGYQFQAPFVFDNFFHQKGLDSKEKIKLTFLIDGLWWLHFSSKKYACALHGRAKLQHYQNKHLTGTLFERHSLLLWSIMPDFCCAFGLGVQAKERQAQSQILVIIEYLPCFCTDPESLSQKKVMDSCNHKRKLDRWSNWQLKNMQQAFHQW